MNSFYGKEFDRWVKDGHGSSNHTLREVGLKHFQELGFPTTRQEEWRFTNVSQLGKSHYSWSSSTKVDEQAIQKLLDEHRIADTYTICMINGVLNKNLSNFHESIIIEDILSANTDSFHENSISTPFTDWNTAFYNSGLYLEIPDNIQIEKPIRVIWINQFNSHTEVVHSKSHVNMGLNSEAVIIDHFLTDSNYESIINHVSGIQLNENSQCEYIKIQEETSAKHFHSLDVIQDANSRYISTQLATGSPLNRNECTIIQQGEGCDSKLYVLGLQRDQHHVDYQTIIRHDNIHGTSREVVKNILRDSSRAVFNGRVIVARGSQKTDAFQSNKNILLSKNARVNANPQLEIYADDVACSHGSTTGELDDDALFYLRSRGIGLDEAQSLMISGFATEVIENISSESIRDLFTLRLENWLEAKA
ncbi:MAG: Fe-S cluster assembly protein SufD [Candidatus Marinimicrobia bacterium]|nr:Fe-S cluster assembly protein SufD [Candidatus Neomarinimicrobiota bacterium]